MNPQIPLWLQIYLWALQGLGTVGCLTFIGYYAKQYKWWTNDFGRHLVAFSGCLALYFLYGDLLAFWPTLLPLTGQLIVGTILYSALVAVIVHRVVLFVRVTRAEERQRPSDQ